MNICIVAYYELRESLLEAGKSFERLGHRVTSFPMFKLIHDQNEKVPDYDDQFIRYISDNNIDVVLWWFINIDSAKFEKIKTETKAKFILFNWDEPFNWDACDIANKCSSLDAAFITCHATIDNYKKHGCKQVYCLPPAFSPDIHKPVTDFSFEDYSKYSCDISFCCTNLYSTSEYGEQYINRKKLIDDIYEQHLNGHLSFALYGPPHLENTYPAAYKGYISYLDQYKVFSYSRINLCTHVLCNYDGYINERAIIIGGSGGLMLIDGVKGLDRYYDTASDVIVLDKLNYIQQIKQIISDYEKFTAFKENIHTKCLTLYTYDKWATFIDDKFLKQNTDI